jgi:hypothetical protein
MKTLILGIMASLLAGGLRLAAAEEPLGPKVSLGDYAGYAEIYTPYKGRYIIEGDSGLGTEGAFQVSKSGVRFNGDVFPWDVQGLQASLKTKSGLIRINFRGRAGNVVVTDVTYEDRKGGVARLIRISAAQAPAKVATKKI